MSTDPTIRSGRVEDASALIEIYAPVIEHTPISFELQVPTVEDFAGRIERYLGSHAWLVAEVAGEILGYAYGTTHRARSAYRFSAETAVYVAERSRGKGVGKRLYFELFERLASRGFFQAYAGVVVPNPASIALHESVGFESIGVFPKVGYKFGEWHDVAWFYRMLRDGTPQENA